MTDKAMQVDELEERISSLPRVRLAALPTPLHEVPRFAEAIGGPRILLKRDDLTGLAFGGNKTRMFEFLLAKAQAEHADIVVGGASVQSNYSRQLAAACAALGLEVELILRAVRGERDADIQGNLLLDLVAGAKVRIISATPDEQRKRIQQRGEELRSQGRRPFVVRMGSEDDLSLDVVSYVLCFCEMHRQLDEQGVRPTHIYVASLDSTQGGLELAKRALGSPVAIVGISPSASHHDIREGIARYANQGADLLRLPHKVVADDISNTSDYVGEGYGLVTSEGVEMVKLMARSEGVFLDPVYTSKAMAALRDHVRSGQLGGKDVVVFVHTGGGPALFAYASELGIEELRAHLLQE